MDAASVREGTLITCDVPTRELILHLNETHNFLLERLDETTLLIDSSFSHIVEAELGKTLERHVFSSRHLFAHEKERPPRERREDRPPREPRDQCGANSLGVPRRQIIRLLIAGATQQCLNQHPAILRHVACQLFG